jgi:hypothetical protein
MTSTNSPVYRLTSSGAMVPARGDLLASQGSFSPPPLAPVTRKFTAASGAATSLSPPPLALNNDRDMTPDSPFLRWGSPAKHQQRRDDPCDSDNEEPAPSSMKIVPVPNGTRRNPSRRVRQQVIAKRHPCYHQQRRAGGPPPLVVKRELTSTAATMLDGLVCKEPMP